MIPLFAPGPGVFPPASPPLPSVRTPTMLRVLLLAALVAVATAQSPKDCKFDTLTTCQATFNDALEIVEPKPWADSVAYRVKIEQLFELDGVKGLRKVCRYFREMKNCMGECYQTLLSVPSLVKDGKVDVDHAYTYMSVFNALHYSCGAGFTTYYANKSCWIKSWKNSRSALEQKRANFEANAAAYPFQACSLANSLLTDFEHAFATGCGPTSRDTQFFGCEYARTAIFTKYPQCTAGCSLPIVG